MRKWDNPSRRSPNRRLIDTTVGTNHTQLNNQISNPSIEPPDETAHQHLHTGTYFGECIGLSRQANSPATVGLLLLQDLSSSTSSSASSSWRRDQLQPRFHHHTSVEPAWQAGIPLTTTTQTHTIRIIKTKKSRPLHSPLQNKRFPTIFHTTIPNPEATNATRTATTKKIKIRMYMYCNQLRHPIPTTHTTTNHWTIKQEWICVVEKDKTSMYMHSETKDKSKQIKKQVEIWEACTHNDDAINNQKRKEHKTQ